MIKGIIVIGSATVAIALGANFPYTIDSTDTHGKVTEITSLPSDDVLTYCADGNLCPDPLYVGRVTLGG